MIIIRAATHLYLKYCRAATNLRLKYCRAGIHRSPTPETTRRAATHPQPTSLIKPPITGARHPRLEPSTGRSANRIVSSFPTTSREFFRTPAFRVIVFPCFYFASLFSFFLIVIHILHTPCSSY